MAEAVNTCPFCGKTFKQLGQHLHRCGKDYQQFLKTSKSANVCPGCHRVFKRLDLHLKNSKSCQLYSADKSSSMSQPQQIQHSWPMDNAQPRPLSRDSDSTSDRPFLPKPRLKLPHSSDTRSWSEADAYMKAVVSPSILSLLSVDKMNSTINDLIYEYFSSRHGIISSPSNHTRKHHKPHAQAALSKVRREKNQMKKEYRKAVRNNTISKVALSDMSKSFHQLVRRHNNLRKEVLQRK